MCYSIYKHTTSDGKAYIGMTKLDLDKRWQNGKGYRNQPLFFNAIIEEGWNNITHEVLEEVETKEEAIEREQYYIEMFGTLDVDRGYNVNGSARLNRKRKEEEENRNKFRIVETGEEFRTQVEIGKKIGRTSAAVCYALAHHKPVGKEQYHIERI